MENGVVEVSEGERLVENVCVVFEEVGKREAVLEVCEEDEGEAGAADSLAEKRRVEVKALFCDGDGVWE